jgi:glutathione S-transferase
MLKFYDFPMAPSPRRARIALAEKGADYETVIVDLAGGEQLSDSFRKVNPQCTVPALELPDGEVLTENAGIVAYLEAAIPHPPLLGTTPTEKGVIASWNARCEFEGLLAIAEALRNKAAPMKDRALTGPENYEQIPALAERGRKRLAAFWDKLDRHLRGRDHIAADQFSVADITAVVAFDFARVIKGQPPEDHEELWRWRRGLDARKSISA